MPKVTPYTDKGEQAIRAAVGSVLGALQISQTELASMIGMHPATLAAKLKMPENFKIGEIWAIMRIAKKGGYNCEIKLSGEMP